MQAEWFSRIICFRFANSKNPTAFWMENTLLDEIINPVAWFERGVELNQWFGPEDARIETLINVLFDPWIANLDETANVCLVLCDEAISKFKDIHQAPRSSSGLFSLLVSRKHTPAPVFHLSGHTPIPRSSAVPAMAPWIQAVSVSQIEQDRCSMV